LKTFQLEFKDASMTVVTEKVLADIVQAIVREVDPERIYLFGSRARGNARADSDVDLLIVERKSFGPQHSRFQEINRVYRVLSSFRVPKDILLYSDDEFAKWRSSINHVVGRCNREGKLLYERS
jgi:predicted nucleotidyltransferase